MAFTVNKKADFLVIEITEELTIFNISECFEFLVSQIKPENEKVIVDLSTVEEMDSSGFQILIWLKQHLCKGKQLSITSSENSALEEFVQRYHFDLNAEGQTQESVGQ